MTRAATGAMTADRLLVWRSWGVLLICNDCGDELDEWIADGGRLSVRLDDLVDSYVGHVHRDPDEPLDP